MFKLLIECSKDIDTLSINFSDGTSVVTESKDKPKQQSNSSEELKSKPQKEYKERKKLDTYLDTEQDYNIHQEIIQKPNIAELNRPVNVSDELQNLDL